MATLSIYKGTALDTTKVAIKDGQLLFETDTKKIWLDSGTNRIQLNSEGIVDLNVNGNTITYTRGDGTTGTITTSALTLSADKVTAGTFAGQVVAKSSAQTPGTSLLRNSKLVTAETNPSYNGEIYWVYE